MYQNLVVDERLFLKKTRRTIVGAPTSFKAKLAEVYSFSHSAIQIASVRKPASSVGNTPEIRCKVKAVRRATVQPLVPHDSARSKRTLVKQ